MLGSLGQLGTALTSLRPPVLLPMCCGPSHCLNEWSGVPGAPMGLSQFGTAPWQQGSVLQQLRSRIRLIRPFSISSARGRASRIESDLPNLY